MTTINGKQYPLWEQFVLRKDEWIGGFLRDRDDDPLFADEALASTKIVDVRLEPNGSDSARFIVVGEDYDCGFDVQFGGVGAYQPYPGEILMTGYGGMQFSIRRKESQ